MKRFDQMNGPIMHSLLYSVRIGRNSTVYTMFRSITKAFQKSGINIILYSVLLTGFIECVSQTDVITASLLNELQKAHDDTSKVNTLIELSEHKRQLSDYVQAQKYATDALTYAESIHYDRGKAHAQSQMGVIFFNIRNYKEASDLLSASLKLSVENGYKDLTATNYSFIGSVNGAQGNSAEAIKRCSEALSLFKKLGNKKGQAISCNHLGTIYRKRNQISEALDHYGASLNISAEINYIWCIAINHTSIGTIYGQRGHYTEALNSFSSALKAWEQLGNKQGISDSYHHFGLVNFYRSNWADALTYYLKALKIRQEIGDELKLAESYHDIGHIYLNQDQPDEALVNYLNALNIFKESGNKQRIAVAYNSLGLAYTDLGDLPRALKNFEESIKIQQEIGDKLSLLYSYNNVGRLYIIEKEFAPAGEKLLAARKLGIELANNEGLSQTLQLLSDLSFEMDSLTESKEYMEQSLALSMDTRNKSMTMYAYRRLAALDSAIGNYQQAFEHHKLYKFYADSIITEDKERIIADLKISYETEKKDHEIQRLEKEHEINKLQFDFQQELLGRMQSEKERIHTENLYSLQQIELLDNEKQVQQLQIDKSNAEDVVQKTEAVRKQDQLALLSKEGEVQEIRLKKQMMLKKYLITGFVLFALLSFFVYNYFITRQKLKLQTLRNKIAIDLHDDVGSTLSSIALFSEIAQQQSKEAIPYLRTIGENSRKMLEAMGDIVWTINPENDQFEKIILRMKSYAYELLGAKKIDFDFLADGTVSQIKLPMDVRKNLFLIFKEATNNIIKYSDADKAFFSITRDRDQLSMMISDNGKGFDLNKPTEGNGLKNMKKRALEVGGKLLIESLPGSGTSINLKIVV